MVRGIAHLKGTKYPRVYKTDGPGDVYLQVYSSYRLPNPANLHVKESVAYLVSWTSSFLGRCCPIWPITRQRPSQNLPTQYPPLRRLCPLRPPCPGLSHRQVDPPLAPCSPLVLPLNEPPRRSSLPSLSSLCSFLPTVWLHVGQIRSGDLSFSCPLFYLPCTFDSTSQALVWAFRGVDIWGQDITDFDPLLIHPPKTTFTTPISPPPPTARLRFCLDFDSNQVKTRQGNLHDTQTTA